MKKLITLMVIFLVGLSAVAAQRTITGNVIGDEGEPLIGATILIKDSTKGTVTDFDGNFSIDASDSDILQISYAGYDTAEIPVAGQSFLNIDLKGTGVVLDELVITGYTTDTRRTTPGSVSTVKAEDLRVVPSGNVEQQLQGRVPGVTVITNGQPGTASQVRVRGYGALGGNQPLYIVDGVPVSSVDFLAPDDIETTTVLKDATSASIYGARAAGGVIVYTTKRGKRSDDGKVKISYDGVVGVTDPGSGPNQLSPQQHADWTWTAIRNAAMANGEEPTFNHPQYGTGQTPVLPDYLLVGSQQGVQGQVNLADHVDLYNVDPTAGPIYQVVRANQSGTDWYDALTRTALLNRHNLGFSGGGQNSRFYAGIGFQDQDGIVDHQKFRRYNVRVNSEFDLTPWLRVGENFQATRRETRLLFGQDGNNNGSSDDENIINMAYRMATIIPVYDEFGGYAGTSVGGFNNPQNVVATVDGQQNDRGNSNEAFGNVYLELEPTPGLVLRTSFGGRYQFVNFYNYTRRTYENSENNSSFGYGQGSSQFSNWTFTNTANYKRSFDVHDVDVLVGQEALNVGSFRSIFSSGINPFSQNTDFVSISTVQDQFTAGSFGNGSNYSSYFGRLKYTFDDKYIFSAVVRRDGSSRFGDENRYGTFPAFSAAWRISSEEFFNSSVISDLKFRGGWGIMGNSNNVDPNNQFSLFGTSIGGSSYDIGGTNGSAAEGFFRTRIGNPGARWEKAITYNFGVDALLNDGKWDIGIEWWRKDTEDLLFQLPVTVQSGPEASAPFVNVGEMKNTGVDFSVTHKNKIGKTGIEVTLNGGFLDNEIVSLADGINDLPNRSTSYRGITPVLNQVGQPLSAFYGYNVLGLFQDQADVDSHAAQSGAAPGRFKFQDVNNDGTVDEADRVNIGNPIPDFTGGLTIKLDFGLVDLEMYSFASIGNEIYNVNRLFTDFYSLFPGAAISSRVLDSWTPQNTGAEIPIFENISNFSTNTQSSSYFVEDGSYFRMQNITIGFDLPDIISDNLGTEKFRAFIGLNNVFTITGYSGLDPSVGGLADTNFGIDVGNFPITRSFTFGINIGL